MKANKPALEIMQKLGFSHHNNLVEAIIFDTEKTSKILNYEETVRAVLSRLRHEISITGGSERLLSLEQGLTEKLNHLDNPASCDTHHAALSVTFKLDDITLSFFSVIAQLSTVQDVTLSEYKIELMFPSDTATEKYYEASL